MKLPFQNWHGLNENKFQEYYNDLIKSANKIQEYIIDAEMGGHLDKTDSFYRTWNGLEELKIKFEEEGDL